MQTSDMRSTEQSLAKDGSNQLISSSKVEGTAVVRSNGETIGSIDHVMIDKRSGQVAYAVMSFGGFLGLGESYYPLPWSMLRYNEQLDGYEVNLTEEQLRNAPGGADRDRFDWNDREFGTRIRSYYDVIPNWTR